MSDDTALCGSHPRPQPGLSSSPEVGAVTDDPPLWYARILDDPHASVALVLDLHTCESDVSPASHGNADRVRAEWHPHHICGSIGAVVMTL